MRYVVALIVGILCGIVAAIAALYFNPLTNKRASGLEPNTVLRFEVPSPGVVASTHGGLLRLPRKPPEIAQLWEATISTAALNVLVLHDDEGRPTAIASRLSKLSESTNLVTNGLILSDRWLITVPGEGTLFAEADSNIWPLVRDTLVDVNLLRRPWAGPRRYEPTIGPESSGTASVVGASGEFLGAYGSATERIDLDAYEEGPVLRGSLRGELRLRIFKDGETASPVPVAAIGALAPAR